MEFGFPNFGCKIQSHNFGDQIKKYSNPPKERIEQAEFSFCPIFCGSHSLYMYTYVYIYIHLESRSVPLYLVYVCFPGNYIFIFKHI